MVHTDLLILLNTKDPFIENFSAEAKSVLMAMGIFYSLNFSFFM